VSRVLDASTVLALMFGEAGSARVVEVLADGAAISAVNLTEVITRQIDRGILPDEARQNVRDLELDVVAFDEDLAHRTALLRATTRAAGQSLGDRACLALAERLGRPALTADKAWATLQLGVQIEVVR
jgi:PIN domain nuclease of toxin-antitoxin system